MHRGTSRCGLRWVKACVVLFIPLNPKYPSSGKNVVKNLAGKHTLVPIPLFKKIILYKMYYPNGISPMRNLACFLWGKPAATESRYPTFSACWVFQCFQNPPNSDMDYRIFNMGTDVNARNCTWRFMDTIRDSALKVDYGEKSLAALGNQTCISGMPVQCCNI